MLWIILRQLTLLMLTMVAGFVIVLSIMGLSKWAFGSHWIGLGGIVAVCVIGDLYSRVRDERDTLRRGTPS